MSHLSPWEEGLVPDEPKRVNGKHVDTLLPPTGRLRTAPHLADRRSNSHAEAAARALTEALSEDDDDDLSESPGAAGPGDAALGEEELLGAHELLEERAPAALPTATASAAVHGERTAPAAGAARLVSVVVPTYRRNDLLRRCLQALLAQSLDSNRFEIMVVDDARAAETERLVGDVAARSRATGGPRVRYVVPRPGAHGPAAARNAGWQAADGLIIAFTDDDTVPAPDWLKNGTAAIVNGVDSRVIAVWGRLVVPTLLEQTDWAANTRRMQESEFITANCFVRRDALARVGGFDERFERPWREDSDLYFSLLEAAAHDGTQIVNVPTAVVVHPVRQAHWGASLRQQRNMRFDALLYKKHRALYRRKIAARPPVHYYAIVIAALVALVCGAVGVWAEAGRAGGFGAAAAAGLVWLVLTARFCWQRLRGTSRRWRHVAEMIATSVVIPPVAVFWRLAGAVRYRVWFV